MVILMLHQIEIITLNIRGYFVMSKNLQLDKKNHYIIINYLYTYEKREFNDFSEINQNVWI